MAFCGPLSAPSASPRSGITVANQKRTCIPSEARLPARRFRQGAWRGKPRPRNGARLKGSRYETVATVDGLSDCTARSDTKELSI